MMGKFGPVNPKEHYLEFDTICDATQVRNKRFMTTLLDDFILSNSSKLHSIQERQDAVYELVVKAEELKLDHILVVGGWDSSNTAHLLEIPIKAGVKSFHINRADCISADNTITHRTVDGEIVTEPFITDLSKDLVMGVTSGASTPDAAVQDSLSSIFMLKKLSN